ncbi:MAG TPA: zinc ribbon domain-containing protein [Pyrinomonadaceae bacterium]
MADLVEEVDGSRGISRTEHALRSVLNDDIESVRRRLARALERLGYNVISDEPLYARRAARGRATYYCSADILEYPIKLTVGLRQLSPGATLATFDYTVEHFGSVSFKGDQRTLRREAEAIIALAASGTTTSVCAACGTGQTDDARFCRVCGAPNAGGAPAEVEVLRLTAGARAGQHLIVAGAAWAAVSLLLALPFIFLSGKPAGWAAVFLLTQVVAGLLLLFVGARSLTRTLNPASSRHPALPAAAPRADSLKEPATFPALPARTSVSDGTTELLAQKVGEREKEPVHRKGRDTSPTNM